MFNVKLILLYDNVKIFQSKDFSRTVIYLHTTLS